ncbi:hypothetical protein, partial [Leptospira noguchii]|uniref:hypothetical protein n=1 Tax=Leptospira noguchii TaxID=28182 RepID=UPI0005693036
SFLTETQNALARKLRVHVYIVKIIFAEEGTRPFTVSRRARLGSGASFSRAHPSMDLHRVFSFLTETQNALARTLRVHVYIVKIIFAEEGTRRFANRHDVSNLPQHIVCFGRVFRFLGKLKTLSSSRFESMLSCD